jgi:transposase
MRGIEPHFPLSFVPRVDDRRIVSGIIMVIRDALRCVTRGPNTGPPKTIDNRFIRWSRLGVFNKIFRCRGREGGKLDQLMIDATHLKGSSANRGQPAQKGDVPRRIGRTKDELNSKLHAVRDGHGRPLIMLLTEGQMNDYRGVLMIDAFPKAKTLLGDRGYDADWFRAALADCRLHPVQG